MSLADSRKDGFKEVKKTMKQMRLEILKRVGKSKSPVKYHYLSSFSFLLLAFDRQRECGIG